MAQKSYHPIHDLWFLARCKYNGGIKRYGGYLGGFPERARRLIGCSINTPMLHVCGGLADLYPYKGGYGPNDKKMDLDKSTEPDFLMDVREPNWPEGIEKHRAPNVFSGRLIDEVYIEGWGGILIDPPYSDLDAAHYPPGVEFYPSPNLLVKNAINAVQVGIKIGIIHYVVPTPPKNAQFVACVGVVCGFNNRIRCFSVFERTS